MTITIHMVSSLDGIVGRWDNSVSWFEAAGEYADGVEVSAEEQAAGLAAIDCYVMGSRTYEHALELSRDYGWVYGDVPAIVVTSRDLPVERATVELYSGDLITLVNERLKPRFNNVWMVGGPTLAAEFLRQKLADEIRQPILPILLGDGIPFYKNLTTEHRLNLKNTTAHKNAMVELHYEILK